MTENNVLNRIRYFLEFKHWTIYKLAKESGLSYSSLNNIFNRNTCPSVITLEKICKGLNISLSEFFSYDENPLIFDGLTDAEQELINSYRSLSAMDKKLLEAYLNGLCKK
ncbi:MAG: helix-turn-helix transcriptional regulator [Lachnospiraceae bacterium]|nr:helix-turn-helix transcriptional regulator [Lachnospiraceae bacterium]MBD5455507.1 helix-turn-helix transcriptional regulator [Lachnospiraceae bacterium]